MAEDAKELVTKEAIKTTALVVKVAIVGTLGVLLFKSFVGGSLTELLTAAGAALA